MRTVRFYDTTLRDGEQMPGVAFSRPARLRIARALDELGIDDIELGFAASGEPQREDMRAAVALGLRARTFSLARPVDEDLAAVLSTGVTGVSFFIGGSDIHLEHKLRMPFSKALDMVEAQIRAARSAGLDVVAALEDGTRTPLHRVRQFAERVAEAGAERMSLADTVGYGTPESVAEQVRAIREVTPDLGITLHAHNDFGLATANALSALQAGADAVSGTIAGIGERSGNLALEEVAAALELRYGVPTRIDLSGLTAICRLVSELSGVPLPANKAVVGGNSFRHESGIHVAALLRDGRTYEPYPPEKVGQERTIVLGKTTGRAAIRHLAGTDTDHLTDRDFESLLAQIKALAETGRPIEATVLDALIAACRAS